MVVSLNILQNGEEAANPIIFTDTGKSDQTAAREVVQVNRDLIINEFVDWIDNNDEFYAYDSVKCERDVQEYILPAVKYDMISLKKLIDKLKAKLSISVFKQIGKRGS